MFRRIVWRVACGVTVVAGLAACSRDHRTPLVIYSPHGRDLLTLFETRFEALHPDIDVRWLDMGSQDVYDRVRSERANPQADIWFGGPSLILAQAAQDSLLDCAPPSWAARVAVRGRGAGDCYIAAYETPVVFLFAEKVVSAAEAPQDWDDLLAPKWTGKIIIRDPLASGTMRAVFGMIVQRGMKQNGDTAPGFAWLRRLDGQTKVYEQNPALVSEKIARQEGLVTIWDLPDVLISRRRGMTSGRPRHDLGSARRLDQPPARHADRLCVSQERHGRDRRRHRRRAQHAASRGSARVRRFRRDAGDAARRGAQSLWGPRPPRPSSGFASGMGARRAPAHGGRGRRLEPARPARRGVDAVGGQV